jgi:hypothetical protein
MTAGNYTLPGGGTYRYATNYTSTRLVDCFRWNLERGYFQRSKKIGRYEITGLALLTMNSKTSDLLINSRYFLGWIGSKVIGR